MTQVVSPNVWNNGGLSIYEGEGSAYPLPSEQKELGDGKHNHSR